MRHKANLKRGIYRTIERQLAGRTQTNIARRRGKTVI
jgi:hypothetical protein